MIALYKEADAVAKRGLIPVIQCLGINENGKKYVIKSMRYAHLTQPDMPAVKRYLEKNQDCNALGVLMQDKFVNLDFDSLVDHEKYMGRHHCQR